MEKRVKGGQAMHPFRTIGRYLRNTDFYLLLIALLCSTCSLFLVNSATARMDDDRYITIQFFAICAGLLVYIILSFIDLERFRQIGRAHV